MSPRTPPSRGLVPLLVAVALLFAPAVAPAHLYAPRLDLDALARGSDAVVLARIEAVEATPAEVLVEVTIERVLRGGLAPGRLRLRGLDHHAGFPVGARRLLLLGDGAPPALRCSREECPIVEDEASARALAAWVASLPQQEEAASAQARRLAPLLVASSRALAAHAARQLSGLEVPDGPTTAALLEVLAGVDAAAPGEGCLLAGNLLAASALEDAVLVEAIARVGPPACRRGLLAPLAPRARRSVVVRALLLRELRAEDERVAFSAATALARAGAPEALERLRGAPQERRVERRRDAAAALAALSCEGVDEAARLAQALASDPAEEVALAASKACPPRAPRLAPWLAGGAVLALLLVAVAWRRRRN